MAIYRKPLRVKILLTFIVGILIFFVFGDVFHTQISKPNLLDFGGNTIKISEERGVSESGERIESRNTNLGAFQGKSGPIRNIILTTWRSGSTFLGEAVASHPGTFYHFEPLMHFKIVQVRSEGSLADEGARVLKNLMNCDYSNLEEYVEFGREHVYVHKSNPNLWKSCQENRAICGDADFLSKTCRKFPIQLLKLVRFRLQVAESLLNDPALNVRILLLIRDPRGVLQSRKNLTVWCSEKYPDCHEPSLLCQDMIQDYRAAEILREKYPDKLRLLRFEDLTLNVISGVEKVLQFFRLNYHEEIQIFLKTHASASQPGNKDVYGTVRDTNSMAFQWIQRYLEQNATEEINRIVKNEECETAMRLWGYAKLDLIGMQNSENQSVGISSPLLEPPWPDMNIS